MVEIIAPEPRERIERVGKPTEVWGFKSCKSMRTFLETHIRKARKLNDIQLEAILIGILEAYNHFHPIRETEIGVEGWKGKSSLEIIKGIDKITIIKYQRRDQFSLPKEIKTEVNREEIIALIESIKYVFERTKDRDYIESKEIAFQFCLNLNIKETDKGKKIFEGNFWDNFFSWRSAHTKLILMLDALRELRLIDYRGGRVKLLNKNISIQMIL